MPDQMPESMFGPMFEPEPTLIKQLAENAGLRIDEIRKKINGYEYAGSEQRRD